MKTKILCFSMIFWLLGCSKPEKTICCGEFEGITYLSVYLSYENGHSIHWSNWDGTGISTNGIITVPPGLQRTFHIDVKR